MQVKVLGTDDFTAFNPSILHTSFPKTGQVCRMMRLTMVIHLWSQKARAKWPNAPETEDLDPDR